MVSAPGLAATGLVGAWAPPAPRRHRWTRGHRAVIIPRLLRAPVAQLDRALPSGGRGQRFESSRARHKINGLESTPKGLGSSVPTLCPSLEDCRRVSAAAMTSALRSDCSRRGLPGNHQERTFRSGLRSRMPSKPGLDPGPGSLWISVVALPVELPGEAQELVGDCIARTSLSADA
jgi:hypothetical protein